MNARPGPLLQHRATAWLAALAFVLVPSLAAAQPDDDLPSRVGRIADVAGEVFVAPEDRAADWSPAALNLPVTNGDNLWIGDGGRLELDVGAGQIRFGGETNVHLSRLDDRTVAIFVAQGSAILRLRVLDPGETARIDTPNTQVTLTRPGLYRIDVSPDRVRTMLIVREGEALLPTPGGVQQVLPGQTAWTSGLDHPVVEVRNGVSTDGFDSWSANRDRRYDRGRSYAYVSPQMIGASELDEWGRWQDDSTYGTLWFPTSVDSGWAPFRDGQWVWVGGWGWTWVDAQPWGFAPSHYGRWVHVNGRWAWAPGALVPRPFWSPAMVGWVGGPGWAFSASLGAPVVGWVPLGWGEPFRPWWNGCSNRCWDRYNEPYAVDVRYQRPGVQPTRYVNMRVPGAVSAVAGASLSAGQSQRGRHVTVPADQIAGAPLLASAPITSRPARSTAGSKPRIDSVPPAASTQYAPGRSASAPPMSNGTRPATSNALPGAVKPAPSRPSTYAAPAAPPATGYPGANATSRPTMTTPVQRETARPYSAPASGQAAAPAYLPPPGQSGGSKPSPSSSRPELAPSQVHAPSTPAYVPQPAAVPRPGPARPVQVAPAPVAPVQVAPAAASVPAAKPVPAPPPARDDRRASEDKPGRSDGGRNDGVRGADKPGSSAVAR